MKMVRPTSERLHCSRLYLPLKLAYNADFSHHFFYHQLITGLSKDVSVIFFFKIFSKLTCFDIALLLNLLTRHRLS